MLDLVLDLLAVSPAGLSSTLLATALSRAGHTHKGRTLKPADVRTILDRLGPDHGVRRSEPWQMDPVEAEHRYRTLCATDRIDAVETLAFSVDDWAPRHYWSGMRPAGAQRMLRRALRMGDDEMVLDCLDNYIDYDALSAWSPPFPTARFDGLTPLGRSIVTHYLLDQSDGARLPLPEGAEAVLAAHRHSLTPEVHLRRGRLDAAAAAVDDPDTLPGGLVALLQGDPKTASQRYAKALAALRKQYGPDVLPQGLSGFFLPLAYLLHGTKGRRKQALTLIDRAAEGLAHLGAVTEWHNLRALDDPQHKVQPAEHPWGVVLESLLRSWRGEPMDAARVDAARNDLRQMGHDMLADELGDDSRLRSLRTVREPWRDTLETLRSLVGSTPAAVEEGPDRRLVYELQVYGPDGDVPHLEPREQLRRKKGWSKGRKVAMDRLYMLDDKDLPWTEDDRRLATGIRRHTERTWRGTRTTYEWHPSTTWRALVGHPHIVSPEGDPIRVVARSPRLVVDDDGSRIRLRLEPDIGPHGVRVTAVGSGYEVVTLADDQAELASVLRSGLALPAKARAELKPILAALGERFEAPGEEVVAAPTDVGAWIRPHGTTLHVELGVQPLGATGPRQAPGEGEPLLLDTRDGRGVRVERDLLAERAHARQLFAWIDDDAELPEHTFVDLEAGLAFLARARAADVPLYWPEGGELVVRRPTKVDIAVRASGQWFRAGGEIDLGDRVLQLVDILQGLLGQGRFVRLDDGSFVELEQRLYRRLDAMARLADEGGRVHRLAASTVADLTEEASVRTTAGANKLLRRIEEPFDAPAVPTVLRATLRPYQVDAYRWLCGLAHLGVGGILADDMGLGKTVVTLAFLLHRRARGPALVVAPTSVAGNWELEARRFAPDLQVVRLGRDPLPELGPGHLVLASYGLLVARADALAQPPWCTVVFDESQALKNPDTQRHAAASALQGEVRVALTGTPVENRLDELHAQMSLVAPDLLPPRRRFRDHFVGPIERDDRDARRLLQRLVAPFLLRRTKEAVLDDLPPRTDHQLLVELGDAERAVYEAQRRLALQSVEEGRGAIEVLAQLTRLRRAACAPSLVTDSFEGEAAKTRAFRHLARDLAAGGHRALVFSQFLDHLALLRAVLDDEGLGYVYLDGSTPSAERDRLVHQYQTTDVPFFLISLKAGGSGLNLTGADYVLHMDPWWNPAVEDQASDRAHRIGQQRPVTVYRVVAKGTVEEQILGLHRQKRDLADRILHGQETVVPLGVEEMREMLELS